MNKAWNTRFWGHTFYDWEDIVVPNALSEEWSGNRTNFQGISLDYRRFQSDSLLDCYKLERDELKRITPDIPVTTNLMGFYPELDYFKWAKEMDVVSWDNYLGYYTAMAHALMRGLKGGLYAHGADAERPELATVQLGQATWGYAVVELSSGRPWRGYSDVLPAAVRSEPARNITERSLNM